jgi:N-acetylglutamate synthase
MARRFAKMLQQTSADLIRVFGHGPRSDCRPLPHGCIALSGEPAADLNMIVLTGEAEKSEFDDALEAVHRKNTDAILIVEEGADAVRGWAADAGLAEVGQMPLMERRAGDVDPIANFHIRLADPAEAEAAMEIAAAAFSLNEAACVAALPGKAIAEDGNDLWLAEEDGELVGCGLFIRQGDHVGIYTMSTPPDHQRRGVGRAILDGASAHYQAQGVERFTLGATEKGYPLYERAGFEVMTSPHVYVVGASTQFPGS